VEIRARINKKSLPTLPTGRQAAGRLLRGNSFIIPAYFIHRMDVDWKLRSWNFQITPPRIVNMAGFLFG